MGASSPKMRIEKRKSSRLPFLFAYKEKSPIIRKNQKNCLLLQQKHFK